MYKASKTGGLVFAPANKTEAIMKEVKGNDVIMGCCALDSNIYLSGEQQEVKTSLE